MSKEHKCKISDEIKAKALELYKNGTLHTVIAEQTGVTTKTILSWVKAASIPLRGRNARNSKEFKNAVAEHYKSGKTFDEVADIMGISVNTTRTYVNAAGVEVRKGGKAVATVLQSKAFDDLVIAWDCEDVIGVEAAVEKMEFQLAG